MASTPCSGWELLLEAEKATSCMPKAASLGCESLDEALGGGVRYSQITSIAGYSQMGKSLIVLHAIASQLLSQELGEVVFIDTTGAFSPVRLRDVLLSKVPPQRAQEAVKLIERVRLMRVFDFVGLAEALGEAETLGDAVKMVVVDSLGTIASSEISKDQAQGQYIVSSFLRLLRQLTLRRRICAILVNSAIAPFSEGDAVKPALGMRYAYLVDLSLLLCRASEVPSAKTASRSAIFARVLHDRGGDCEGKTGIFRIENGIGLADA